MDENLGDEPGGLCAGCLRSIDEIIAWGMSSDDEKRAILERVDERRRTPGSRTMKPVLDWYFDFISPFSYLQSSRLARLATHATVVPRPVLFAGLLAHWGNIGPAELAPKRLWTFEHCAWLAHQHHIPMTLPSEHPFNPLPLLRLALALGDRGSAPIDVVERLFHFVWVEGRVPGNAAAWSGLLDGLGMAAESINAPAVKDALRANGEAAIAAGVFGVPSAVIDGHVFWGFDATEMIEAYLAGDAFFDSGVLKAARELPGGIERRRPAP